VGKALAGLLADAAATVETYWRKLLEELPTTVRRDKAFMAGLEAGYKAGFYDGGTAVPEAQLQDACAERPA